MPTDLGVLLANGFFADTQRLADLSPADFLSLQQRIQSNPLGSMEDLKLAKKASVLFGAPGLICYVAIKLAQLKSAYNQGEEIGGELVDVRALLYLLQETAPEISVDTYLQQCHALCHLPDGVNFMENRALTIYEAYLKARMPSTQSQRPT